MPTARKFLKEKNPIKWEEVKLIEAFYEYSQKVEHSPENMQFLFAISNLIETENSLIKINELLNKKKGKSAKSLQDKAMLETLVEQLRYYLNMQIIKISYKYLNKRSSTLLNVDSVFQVNIPGSLAEIIDFEKIDKIDEHDEKKMTLEFETIIKSISSNDKLNVLTDFIEQTWVKIDKAKREVIDMLTTDTMKRFVKSDYFKNYKKIEIKDEVLIKKAKRLKEQAIARRKDPKSVKQSEKREDERAIALQLKTQKRNQPSLKSSVTPLRKNHKKLLDQVEQSPFVKDSHKLISNEITNINAKIKKINTAIIKSRGIKNFGSDPRMFPLIRTRFALLLMDAYLNKFPTLDPKDKATAIAIAAKIDDIFKRVEGQLGNGKTAPLAVLTLIKTQVLEMVSEDHPVVQPPSPK